MALAHWLPLEPPTETHARQGPHDLPLNSGAAGLTSYLPLWDGYG